MIELVRKFLRLERGDRRRFGIAWLMVPAVGVGLRILGSERVLGLVERSARRARRSRPLGASRFGQLASLVDSAARYGVLGRNCLRESLVLYWLAKRAGLDARLEIGVRKVGGALEAHAWVDPGALEGRSAVNGTAATGGDGFLPFDRPILSCDRG